MSVVQAPKPQAIDLEDVAALLKESLADGRLDAGEVLKIAMKVAEKANRLAGLSGAEKKMLVVTAVEKAVRAAVPAEQAEQVVSTALQVLPAVLDIAVAAARGRLALEAAVKQKVSLGCLVDCFAGLFGSRKAAPLSAKEPVAAPALKEVPAAAPQPAAAPAPQPAAAPAPQPATPESATPPPTAQPGPAPPQEIPEEPTPEASPEAPPVESRPAEEPETTLPNTATDLPAQ